MGIGRAAYRLLLEEKKKGVLKGERVLQLGRQGILFDKKTLYKYAKQHQVPLADVEPQLSFDTHQRSLGFIDDITLFKALGFKDICSMDFSDFEGATHVHDLNEPIPESWGGQFDVIYDGGTAEHVFNFPQVLKNIHHLLKEGGVIIHASPSHNHVDHGFYMFSPQVFTDYYTQNRYEILTSQIFEYSPKHSGPWRVYNYTPGVLDKLSYGGFGKAMLGIHMIVQKKPESTCGEIPQQGLYLKAWKAKMRIDDKKRVKVNPIRRLGISLNKKIQKRLPPRVKAYFAKKKLSKVGKI